MLAARWWVAMVQSKKKQQNTPQGAGYTGGATHTQLPHPTSLHGRRKKQQQQQGLSGSASNNITRRRSVGRVPHALGSALSFLLVLRRQTMQQVNISCMTGLPPPVVLLVSHCDLFCVFRCTALLKECGELRPPRPSPTAPTRWR